MFFLKRLEAEHRQLLREYLVPVNMEQGKAIFTQMEPAHAMYFVEVGSVRLSQKRQEGLREVEDTVSVVKSGEFFGEEALLGEKNVHQFSAVCLESGTLQALYQTDLEKIIAKSPAGGTKILLEISRSYREVLDEPKSRGSLFLFYGPRDGGGRTTLAINTAIVLAQQTKESVAFLDGDFQLGNAALLAGSTPVPNIGQLIQGERELTMKVIRKYQHPLFGVDFLWGPPMPQDSDLINREALRRILAELLKSYRYIVVESKCYIDEQTLLLWDEADRFCLIGTPDMGFLERTKRLKGLFASLNYTPERMFGVMGMSLDDSGPFVEKFQNILERPVIRVRFGKDFHLKAEMAGKPLAVVDPQSPYVQDVLGLVNVLLDKKVETPRAGGIFSRLASFFG